jgi:quinol monooxygenase YgiN
MSVLVQFIVEGIDDVDHFIEVMRKWQPTMAEEGARNASISVDENNATTVTTMAEWDSHDVMHAASEKHGEAINAEVGQDGLNWITHLWHAK